MSTKRQFPSYTTEELKASVAYIKANGKTRAGSTGVDATMTMIALEDEIDRRESGESVGLVVPQIAAFKG